MKKKKLQTEEGSYGWPLVFSFASEIIRRRTLHTMIDADALERTATLAAPQQGGNPALSCSTHNVKN